MHIMYEKGDFSDVINHSLCPFKPISNIWGWMNKLSILDFQLLAINQNMPGTD